MKKMHFKLSSCLRFIACAALMGMGTNTWADDEAIMSLRETRTSSFQYYGTTTKWAGMLLSEAVEPNTADQCVYTSYVYDNGNINAVHGNQTSTSVMNCNGASSAAQFTARTSSVAFDGNGQFPVSSTNAAGHTESYGSIDSRFGIAQSQTGPNNLTSTVTLDELGRKVKTTAPDGSYTTTYTYTCSTTDQSVDPQGSYCAQIKYTHPTTGTQINADSYSETLHYAPNGTAQGGVARAYYDSMGREIGSVQTGVDLPGQTTTYRRVLKAYDSQGRQAYTSTVHLVDTSATLQSGSTLRWNVTTFDSVGRPSLTFAPDDSGANVARWQNDGVALDSVVGLGKVGLVVHSDGQAILYQYSSTNGWINPTTEVKNALGQLTLKTDAYGNQIAYRYDAQGQLVGTKDGAGNITVIHFDTRGRKDYQSDPDLGYWTYTYDALGQLKTQTDAKSQIQSMAYDVLGRLISKVVPSTSAVAGFTASYSYDCNQASNLGDSSSYPGKGSLCQETTTQGYSKQYAFDNLGRAIHTRTNLGTASGSRIYDDRQSFDSYGRLQTSTYPTGVQTSPQYSTNGVMIGLNRTDSGLNKTLWTATGLNQYGNIQQWQLGNGLITTEWRDVQGRLTSKNTGTVAAPTSTQNLQYTFTQAGDLATRQDVLIGILDTFNHDALHRLVQWVNQNPYQTGGSYTVGYTYDGLGNITYRSDRGSYAYGASSSMPHALTTLNRPAYNNEAAVTTTMSYDANGSLSQISQNGSVIKTTDWTSFNQPGDINWTGSGSPRRVEWLYGSNFQRIQETHLISNGSGGWNVASKVFKLNPDNQNGLYFEQVVDYSKNTTEDRHYLSTPVGTIGMLVTYGEIGSGTTTANAQIRYWHTDHLGSLTALTDDNGSVLERFQYDPFGVQLDAQGNVVSTSRYTDRGFTQHEEIADLGLVHMNGRVFDPYTGRFLSGDSNIQNPTELQSYNRYSYCYNSPMLCTDPSGYLSLGDALGFTLLTGGDPVASVGIAASMGINNYIQRQAWDLQRQMPGQQWVDSYIMNHQWAYMAGQMIATYYGGVYGAMAWSSYYSYVGTGSMTAAMRSAAITYVTATAFYVAGDIGEVYGVNGWQAYAAQAGAGCISGQLQGGGCGRGAVAAMASHGIGVNAGVEQGSIAEFAVTVVSGGTASVLTGGKFVNGARTSAFQYMFNRLQHMDLAPYTDAMGGNYSAGESMYDTYGDTFTQDVAARKQAHEWSFVYAYGLTVAAEKNTDGNAWFISTDLNISFAVSPTGLTTSLNYTPIDTVYGAYAGYGHQVGVAYGDIPAAGFGRLSESKWIGAATHLIKGGGISANYGDSGLSGGRARGGDGYGTYLGFGKTKSVSYTIKWDN